MRPSNRFLTDAAPSPRPVPECSRRAFFRGSAAGLAALATGCSSQPPRRPPNIVLFLADDLGYGDLSSYGAPDIHTPRIDSIGARGVRFTQAYANAPECTPTRTALLTGRYQQRVGGLECAIGVGNVGRYDEAEWLQRRDELGLPAAESAMVRLLAGAGYATALFGKWHLGYLDKFSPNRHGFDEFYGILGGNADYFTHREAGGRPVLYHNERRIEEEGYFTHLIRDRALEWLGRRRGTPFFLYLPFTAPHTPVQGPGDRGRTITEDNFNQGDRAGYAAMVEAMDEAIGAVLDRLDAVGAAENTLVAFQSDNGGYALSRNTPFRGGKGQLWEGGIRVPAMMRWPGVIPEAQTTAQVSLSMDLLPTFLAAAGIARPPQRGFDGVNLLPFVTGEREPFFRTVYWRYKRLHNRRKAVRHGDMKYLWDNGDEYLYHLGADIHEDENLIAELPDIAADLRDRLIAWEDAVHAPRLAEFPG